MITFILIACSILALTVIWLFCCRLARRIPRAIKAVTLLTTLVVLAVVGLLLDVVCLVSLIATIGHHRFLGIVLAATKAVCIGCSKPADPSKPNPIQWLAADGILPEPQVFQPRVDHSRTCTWSVERVAWLPWHADQDALRDAVYLEGQKLVAHTRRLRREHPGSQDRRRDRAQGTVLGGRLAIDRDVAQRRQFEGSCPMTPFSYQPIVRFAPSQALPFVRPPGEEMTNPESPGPVTWLVRASQSLAALLRPSKPTRPQVLVVVEGPNDIEFLRRISAMLHRDSARLPDLADRERQGRVVFAPTGGVDLSTGFRYAGLALPEFHLLDRDIPPVTQTRHQIAAMVNSRSRCRAAITSKRSLENYLHPAAIFEASGFSVAFSTMTTCQSWSPGRRMSVMSRGFPGMICLPAPVGGCGTRRRSGSTPVPWSR